MISPDVTPSYWPEVDTQVHWTCTICHQTHSSKQEAERCFQLHTIRQPSSQETGTAP